MNAGEQVKIDESWHVDKRVPISLILVIIIQSVALIYWGSGIDHQVEINRLELENRRDVVAQIPLLSEKVSKLDDTQRDLSRSISKLERQTARTEVMVELLLRQQGIQVPDEP